MPYATVGDQVTGRIEVDLATVPANGSLSDTVGAYSYLARVPGYTFSFSVGDQSIRYDSRNASDEGGPGPGIGMHKGPDLSDGLMFTLRDQGSPYTMNLGIFDHTAPKELLSGTRFPFDVHASSTTIDAADFSYSDLGYLNYFDALITRISVSIVPEPTTTQLVLGGAALLMLKTRATTTRSAERKSEANPSRS